MNTTKTSIFELINKAQMDLMYIKRRWYVLHDAEKELGDKVRGKPFRVHNDVLWAMFCDYYDMLVIDLASFARGILEEGGLLGQIKARCNELPREIPYCEDDPSLEKILAKYHTDAFERLFKKAMNRKGTGPGHDSIDNLQSRFRELVRVVVDDRDRHRAHKFERSGNKEAAKILGVDDLYEIFKELETLLNDLRLLCNDSAIAYTELNYHQASRVAPELIDIVLLGHAFPQSKYWEREAAYAALHEAHNTTSDVLFNDIDRLDAVLGDGWVLSAYWQ